MSTEIVIKNYAENTDLLPGQFRDSIKLRGVIESFNDQSGDLETALFEIRDYFWLYNAVGAQLDVIGSILNFDREGRTDSEYRVFLQTQAGNIFSGTPEDIMSALKNLYGLNSAFYSPGGVNVPCEYYIRTDSDDISNSILDLLSPAGVRGFFVSQLVPVSTPENNIISVSSGYNIVTIFRFTLEVLVTELDEEIVTETDENIVV
mgnify:CR=1 FL=1